MHIAYIGIGANLGDPQSTVNLAVGALRELPNTWLEECSSIYRTAPVGFLEQPDFINAVAQVLTGLSPQELLEQLLMMEARFGRERSARNAPRTLDLDLLLYGDQALSTPELTLPHPRMSERAFVLVPLAEIAPDVTVGRLGSVTKLLAGMATDGVFRIGKAQADTLTCSSQDS